MPLIYANDPELTDVILHYEHLREQDSSYKIVLCEGDSWFSIGGLTSSVLLDICDIDKSEHILLVSCAYPGHTAKTMSEVVKACIGNFLWLLNPKYGTKWDAVLLSMGGNDIIDWLDSDSYDIQDVKWFEYYSDMLSYVYEANQLCPVIAHGYSIPEIQYSKTWYNFWKAGPWLGPRLNKKYPPESYKNHKREIRRYFREFHSVLRKLEVHNEQFYALLPYEHYAPVEKWQNEIHPARGLGGYKGVAAAFYSLIESSHLFFAHTNSKSRVPESN